MDNIAERTVGAWAQYIQGYIDGGWRPYLLTFMFEPLPGSQAAKMHQMAGLLEKAYAVFVTRVVRKPRSRRQDGGLPIMLCSPDLPVYKRRKRHSLRDLIVNDGLHLHTILLVPPWARVKDVAWHFEKLRPTYRRVASIDRIDVEPIVDRLENVVGYGLKSTLKTGFDVGDNFLLPRSRSELAA